MNKKIKLLIITVLFVCAGLTGCFEGNNEINEVNRFVGSWEFRDVNPEMFFGEYVTFFSNSTVLINNTIEGTYEIKDGDLVIKTLDGSMRYVYEYSFTYYDRILKLKKPPGIGGSYSKQ